MSRRKIKPEGSRRPQDRSRPLSPGQALRLDLEGRRRAFRGLVRKQLQILIERGVFDLDKIYEDTYIKDVAEWIGPVSRSMVFKEAERLKREEK